MKRVLFFLFCFFCFMAAPAQTGEPAFLPTFKPLERVHDFGTVYEKDGKVEHVFKLRNTGKAVAVISNVNTWCGCMVAEYTKKPVRPGGEATVKVTFDPDHKSGNFVKQVVLLLNDGRQYVRLWGKANVVGMLHPVREDHPYAYGHGLYMSQQLLPFPDLAPGQRHAYDLKLANDTDRPMTVVFERRPNNTVLKMPARVTLKPRERTAIRVSYRYFRRHTESRHVDIVPIVNGKPGRPLTVRWNVGRKFKLDL